MKYKIFLLIMLGMLTAFGPFVTDMYVPSLPSMVTYFHTTITLVQAGLTASMLGLAAGQLLFGPLSDKYGRRRPLMASLVLFAVSSTAILFSPTIHVFVALRFVQGFAGAGGIVISRSVATDMYSGRELMKILGITGAINGIAPIMAPVAGGALVDHGGWRMIFALLLMVGVALMAGSWFMHESLPVERRTTRSLPATFKLFGVVVRNRTYMLYVLHQAAALAILFGNISSSPFIVQEHYGLSPLGYSIVFGLNGASLAIGAGSSMKFRRATTCVKVSCAGMLAGSLLVAMALMADAGLAVYEVLLDLMLVSVGFTLTASTTLALDCAREEAGTASALFGAVGFVAGGVVSPLVGMGSIMHSSAITFVTAAVLALAFAVPALRRSAAAH